MGEENKARAVGYCRTASGTDGIAEQRAAVKAYARRQGYELVGVFEDPGISGLTATGDRPGFHQVVQLAEAGEIAVLVVHRLDRIGRDLARVLPAVEWLRDQGVEIRSVTERIDTTVPADAAVFAVLATVDVDPPDDAALLQRVYDLRRRGRTAKEVAAALNGLGPNTRE